MERRLPWSPRRRVLKIQRKANGDVELKVSGRLDADNLDELCAMIAAEPVVRGLVLDLVDLILVDRDTVHFLCACERDGIVLRDCPRYVRTWMAREAGEP